MVDVLLARLRSLVGRQMNGRPGGRAYLRDLLATAVCATAISVYAQDSGPAIAKSRLPDWLQPLDGNGLLVDVDDVGDVVKITAGEIVDDDLLAKFALLPRLRELHVETTDQLTREGLSHLGEMTSLTRLTLYNVSADQDGLGDDAIRSVVGLKRLVDLEVSECGVTDVGVRCLEGMPHLTSLKLRHEGRLTDAALASIGRLTELRHLDLSSYVATEAYGRMQFSAEAIRHLAPLKQLESLHLVGHPVPSDAIVFDRLKSLSLGSHEVDDACAARVAQCHDLTSLELCYTGITDEGLKQLAELPLLTHLTFDSHFVTDDGIAYLKGLPSLQTLNLRASRITGETLTHLAEFKTLTQLDLHGSGQPGSAPGERLPISEMVRLKILPKLHSLRLTNFRSSEGYRDLGELRQLRMIEFFNCNVSKSDVRALREALPNTKVHGVGPSFQFYHLEEFGPLPNL
jgi:hypothetical protein